MPKATDSSRDAGEHGRFAGGRYGSVLGIPSFRALWLAQMLANLGEALSSVALPLLAYAITGSAQLASQVFVARLLPMILLAPVSGVLVDRLDRRILMLAADIIRAGLVILIPFCTEAWQLAAIAALVAVNDAIARPAGLAAVPAVVPADQLVTALSASQVGSSAIRVAGPAAGAAIIGVAGPGLAFGLQAVCFLLSAAALIPLRLPRPARPLNAPSIRHEMWEGLEIVRFNPVVRGTAAVEALWQTMTAMLAIALVVYVERALRLGPDAGSVYALLVVPALATPPLPVLFACWLALGFTDAWAVIAMQAYLAEAAPDRIRGRVYAGWTAAVTAGAAVAFLVVGWLTTAWGPAATIGFCGLLVGVGGPVLLWATGALDAMRRHVPVAAEPAEATP